MSCPRTGRIAIVHRTTFAIFLLFVLCTATLAYAQRCVVDVVVLNRNRKVTGDVNVECGRIHSKPFGNWGAIVRAFGGHRLRDGYQFSGWKVDDGWLQRNSCTSEYRGPDRRYYNDEDYTAQIARPNIVNVVESRRDHSLSGPDGKPCNKIITRQYHTMGSLGGSSKWMSRS